MQLGELLVGSPPRRWAVSVCCGPMVLGRPTGQLLYPTLDKRRPLGPPPTLPRTTGGPSETDCLARQPSLHPRPSPPPPSHHTARARRPHWQRPRNATRSGRRASHARGPPRPSSGHSRTDVMSTRPRQPRPTDASGGGWSAARLRQHALPLTACQRGHTRRPQRGTVRARCVEGSSTVHAPRCARAERLALLVPASPNDERSKRSRWCKGEYINVPRLQRGEAHRPPSATVHDGWSRHHWGGGSNGRPCCQPSAPQLVGLLPQSVPRPPVSRAGWTLLQASGSQCPLTRATWRAPLQVGARSDSEPPLARAPRTRCGAHRVSR